MKTPAPIQKKSYIQMDNKVILSFVYREISLPGTSSNTTAILCTNKAYNRYKKRATRKEVQPLLPQPLRGTYGHMLTVALWKIKYK